MFSPLLPGHLPQRSLLCGCVQNIQLHLCEEQGRLDLDTSTGLQPTSHFSQVDQQAGFLNEAKEWAGELLSGQTKVAW